ncbi:MAG: peptidoglycan-binding protein [Nitratireductor sp.]|nr:peptidoglycan-binding protein [Nitratireductor sp.]
MNTYEIQARLHALGIYKGRVDGINGPLTRAAIRGFQRINGLYPDGIAGRRTIAALKSDPIAERQKPDPVRAAPGQGHARSWPRQADVEKFYGPPGSHACTAGEVQLPFPMRLAWDKNEIVRTFNCHHKVAASFESIFDQVLKHYGLENIRLLGLDLYGGCYNFRKMRGGNRYSMHSWGIALDIDPARNQLKWGRDQAKLDDPEYEPFWSIVEEHGGVSLGRLRNYDWMHFQFARL